MKTFFKYSGGKSKEFKRIKSLVPVETKRVVEPFAGSCAVSFGLELPALVADTRENVINALNVVQDAVMFKQLQALVDNLKLETDIEKLKVHFYEQRDGKFGTKDPVEKAYRWIVIRQLVFSGIDRINIKTGKFNAPFGWYKNFACHLSEKHHKLMQSWNVELGSFEQTLAKVKDGDWIFIDPPYLGRNSTYDGVTETQLQEMHEKLFEILCKIKQPWLIIHSDCEFYRKKYSSFCINEIAHKYSQNFKGRDSSDQKVKHLYISNYQISSLLYPNLVEEQS